MIDKTDGFQPKKRENYCMRTLKTLSPLGLNVENAVTATLDWTVWTLNFRLDVGFYIHFCFSITPVIPVSTSFGSYWVD